MLEHISLYERCHGAITGRSRMRMTRAQAILWNELKGRKMLGHAFHRLRLVDRYIVDFYCKELALAVEVVGGAFRDPQAQWHDEERTIRLRLCGVAVLQFTDEEVVHNLDGVIVRIRQSVRRLPWK